MEQTSSRKGYIFIFNSLTNVTNTIKNSKWEPTDTVLISTMRF